MRDKQRTIESLRRLAERPGTPQEGETARKKLREMESKETPRVPPSSVPSPRWGNRVRPTMSPEMAEAPRKDEAAFKRDLRDFFRNAGYVPRKSPKSSVASWEEIEARIRRHIYKDQGDPE